MTRSVPSPCINVCRMHAGSGWCEGCLRTLDEITQWSTLADEGKRAVWVEIGRRRAVWRTLKQSEQPDGDA